MGFFRRVFDDYFDDRAKEISENGSEDSDSYDDGNELNNPASPVWDGSEVHYNPFGGEPELPGINEVSQD